MTWWEVWLRIGTRPTFDAAAQRLDLMVRRPCPHLPRPGGGSGLRDGRGSGARCRQHPDTIAELRLARDAPGLFMAMDGAEQRLWSDDLARRITQPPADAPAVCLLNSGTTYRHPLEFNAVSIRPISKLTIGVGPLRISAVSVTVGTVHELSGLALHGDLADLLATNSTVSLRHRLETGPDPSPIAAPMTQICMAPSPPRRSTPPKSWPHSDRARSVSPSPGQAMIGVVGPRPGPPSWTRSPSARRTFNA